MKFEIKSWMTGGILFSIETTTWRLALESAVKSGADLRSADLSSANLSFANLRSADLSFANLRSADLSSADLRSADLSSANLSFANLSSADLSFANLRSADLSSANLSFANLSSADLSFANLRSADLSFANLSFANLRSANLSSAKNSSLAIAMTRILPQGDLIGWKKCNDGVIVKLSIPARAKRSHAFGRKCRAQYVDVLQVIGAKEGVTNQHGPVATYRKGKRIKPDKWDDDYQNECSNGIHFFITREEAEAWQ